MKKKQHFFILSLLLILLTSCGPTDREQLNGKWKINEIHLGKDLVYCKDAARREKIVERVIAEQKASLPEEAWGELDMMRDFFREKLKKTGETTLIIRPDNTFTSQTIGPGDPIKDKGKLTLDEEKKELVLIRLTDELFKYELENNKLTLVTKENGKELKLEFRRL